MTGAERQKFKVASALDWAVRDSELCARNRAGVCLHDHAQAENHPPILKEFRVRQDGRWAVAVDVDLYPEWLPNGFATVAEAIEACEERNRQLVLNRKAEFAIWVAPSW